MDDDDEDDCRRRKCKTVPNPCKICLQTCKSKNAIQCTGACGSWVHYDCANLTKGKIQDIKSGVIEVTCPCPDCKSSLPKEILVGEKALFACNNVRCPANNPPSCASDKCQANLISARRPKRCPPPGTLRKCGRDLCRVFSKTLNTYSYLDECSTKCEYKHQDDSCYDKIPENMRKTFYHRDDADAGCNSCNSCSSNTYSCSGDSPTDACCDVDLPENARFKNRPRYTIDGSDDSWPDRSRCRKPHNHKCPNSDDDCNDNESIVVCSKPKRSKCKKKKPKKCKKKELCCCKNQDNDSGSDHCHGYDQQHMAEEMMEMCKTVVNLEHRIEAMLGKIVSGQPQPVRSNRRWQVHMASVNRGTYCPNDIKNRNSHHYLHDEKREQRSVLRKKYERSFKKLIIIVSAIFARMRRDVVNKVK